MSGSGLALALAVTTICSDRSGNVLEDFADRITRGGSWLSQEPEAVQVTFRTFDPPFNAYEDLGMRVVVAHPVQIDTG